MKKLIPILVAVIIFLAVILSAYNFQTTYNPFTSKLDYHITSNMSGENITADNFFGNLNSSYIQNEFWVNISGDTMTGNLNMGLNNLSNFTSLTFNGNEKITWNEEDHTMNVPTGLGNTIQVGQELTFIAKNMAGKTIYNGQAVYIGGVSGERPEIFLADASNSSKIHHMGVVTIESCNDNAACPITIFGFLRELNTSQWSVGDKLYVSSDGSGNLTNTLPSFPNYPYHIATVIKSHSSTGILNIKGEFDFMLQSTMYGVDIVNNLSVNTSNLFVNANLGRVGIGTSSPGTTLDINVSNDEGVRIYGTGGSDDPTFELGDGTNLGNEGLKLWYDSSAGAVYFDNVWNNANADILFRTKTTGTPVDALTIKGSGKVGIGTTTPQDTLDVVGTINFTTLEQATDGVEWIKPEHVFDIDKADIETDLNTFVDIAGDTMTGNLNISGANLTVNETTFFVNANLGLVGIGTSSPDMEELGSNYKVLTVYNPVSLYPAVLELGTQNSISTSATMGRIHFMNGANRIASIEADPDGGVNNSGNLKFETMNSGAISTRMTIDKDGNVGIGTSSPQDALDVSGYVNASSGFKTAANTGATGNYSVGSCYLAFAGGIMYSTNCTAF